MTLTLERAAPHGATVTLTYEVPSADPIQDTTGNDAAGLTDEEVTNATPDPSTGGGGPPSAQPPEEGEVSGSGETVTLTFAEELDETSVPAPSDFTVTLAAASSASSASSGSSVASPQTEDHRVTEVSVEGKALELTISPPVPAGRSVTVRYAPAAASPRLRTAAGANVGEFTTTVAGSDAPRFGPDAPSVLEVAENTAAGEVVGTVSATAADGGAVTYALAGADGGSFAIDDDGRITVGADTSLDFERRETYEVTVTASAGDAEASRDVTIQVLDVDEPPAAPEAPSVAAAFPSSVEVSWSAPANTGPPIDDYDVRWFEGGADPPNEADWVEAGEDGGHDHVGTATSATIPGLAPHTAYRVQVRASNDEGASGWSASGGGSTGDDQLTFGPDAPSVLEVAENTAAGEVVGTVSATAADGAVTYALAGADGGSVRDRRRRPDHRRRRHVARLRAQGDLRGDGDGVGRRRRGEPRRDDPGAGRRRAAGGARGAVRRGGRPRAAWS